MRPLDKLEQFEVWSPSAEDWARASKRKYTPVDTVPRGHRRWAWVAAAIAAGIMTETLFFKFTGAPESKYIFTKMGTEPWMRWVQGIWELCASIYLIWPGKQWAGGVLTVGAMSAALLSHLSWLGISVQGDHGLLFGMATVTLCCGLTVMVIHRRSIPNYLSLSHH